MDETNTPTRVREDSAAHVIQVLNQLKELLTLSESDPLCRQSLALYDTVESTLEAAHRELEVARNELSRNQNETTEESRNS